MKKVTILGICITAFVAIAAWAPNVLAFNNSSSCGSCHDITGGPGDATHDFHTSIFSCSVCHVNIGDNPVVANSCANCHDAAPLQANHHYEYEGATCTPCHNPQAPVETNCSDGIDNNNNGMTDCADPDCDGFVFTGQETTCGVGACEATGNLECRNSGQFDTCQPGSPSAEGPFDDASCSDGIDNDCDGLTDAGDSDCDTPPEICDDDTDNNGNGLVDCADPQCDGFAYSDVTTCGVGACQSTGSVICQDSGEFDTCQPFAPEAEGPFDDASCSDGIDNDCDGLTDVSDPDCAAPPEICDDGADNNGNGLVDCADPQCDGFQFSDVTTCGQGACVATGNLACSNLGQVDTCQPGVPENEGPYGDLSCSDGIDNDCNNQTDDADTNCQAGPETCDNNIDDNGDGLVDCADPQCDGFIGQPGSCNTSLAGICSAGTISCDLGETFCDQDTQAATEGPFTSPTCNDSLDNDCDELTDGNDPDCIAPEPEPFCGDGNLDAGEQCDDGNNDNSDGCEADCTLPVTGGCSEADLPVMTEMEYNRGDEKLHLHGQASSGTTLTVVNAATGETLAERIRVRRSEWEAEIQDVGSSLEHVTIISSNSCTIDLYIGANESGSSYDDNEKERRGKGHGKKRRER